MNMVWGAIVVLAAIGIVVWPLLMKTDSAKRETPAEDSEFSELLAKKDSTLFAINELESDFEMGSLSHSDYEELRKKYEDKALALIRTTDQLRNERQIVGVRDIDREIEQRVSSLRAGAHAKPAVTKRLTQTPLVTPGSACTNCGAPVGSGDAFCSHCGSPLASRCPECAAAIKAGDLFCGRCGASLHVSAELSEAA
jgi:hypothetical protein